jgi:hypothetical protein
MVEPRSRLTTFWRPGGVFDDFNFVSGRIDGEVLAIVGELRQLFGLNMVEHVSERHVTLEMVVAVGFAVGGNVHELLPATVGGESAH